MVPAQAWLADRGFCLTAVLPAKRASVLRGGVRREVAHGSFGFVDPTARRFSSDRSAVLSRRCGRSAAEELALTYLRDWLGFESREAGG